MNCVVIGCGRISDRHFKAIGENGLNLVGVSDIIEEKAIKASNLYGVRHDVNYKNLLNDDVDLVSICTYPSRHCEIAVEAMSRGCNVLVEKPAALKISEAEEMVNAAIRYGVKIFEVRQNRYNGAMRVMKSCVDKGSFGVINIAIVRLLWCRYKDYFEQDELKWRGTWKHDGGVLASQGCHHVDAISWLMGEVDTVEAKGYKAALDIECEDTATATIKFKNGCLGLIHATNAVRPKNIEASIMISGDKGSMIVSGTHLDKITHCTIDGIKCDDQSFDNDIYGTGHNKVYESIKKYLSGEVSTEIINGKEILKSIKLVNCMYKSMEENRVINFSEYDLSSSRLGV